MIDLTQISGLLNIGEAQLLAQAAQAAPKHGAVVELGTFQGGATAVLCDAVGDGRVVTIDNWSMQHHGENGEEIARRNLAKLGYNPRIVSGQSHIVPEEIEEVACLVVDTDHRAIVLRRELGAWLPRLTPEAVVIMHDYGNPSCPTMKPEIDARFAGWDKIGLAGWLIAYRAPRHNITVVLLNYARPKSLDLVVDALGRQTNKLAILLVDNSGKRESADVRFNWNGGCYARLLMALYAQTEWVMFLDDDLVPADIDFVHDALVIARQRPNVITGAFGRRFSHTPPHYHGQPDVTGQAALVKGRFMLFRRELLGQVNLARFPLHYNPDYLIRCDDLYLSLETGHGDPVHWVDPDLQKRLVNLPDDGIGLEKQVGHFQKREMFCRQYIEEILQKERST